MPRLLLVEDEFLIRMTLSEILTDEGFEVIEASDGPEAISLIGTQAPDIVLTDLNLPGGMNGFAVAAALRAHAAGRPDLPVLFTSGEAIAASRLGPHDRALAKPYLPSTVARVLTEMMAPAAGAGD